MHVRLRPLAEQVVVITGASSGIGLITARKAAAAGAKLVLVARNETALAEIARDMNSRDQPAIFVVADVGDPREVEQAAQRAVERFGRIDTWINNAGVTIYATLSETPIGEHERMFRTNYFGVVNGTSAALPHLRAQGGALITVASIVSDIPTPLMGAYSASKHAVKAFVNSLRIELKQEGAPIAVTLIKPAGIDTPIAQHAANHQQGEARIPPLVYDPELVADAILDAAEHPRRDVTVGGAGRLNVLVGTHFPALLDRLAPLLVPFLEDKRRAPTPDDNLFGPAADGEVRSPIERGKSVSLYTLAGRHKPLVLGTIAALAIGGFVTRRALHRPDPAD